MKMSVIVSTRFWYYFCDRPKCMNVYVQMSQMAGQSLPPSPLSLSIFLLRNVVVLAGVGVLYLYVVIALITSYR